MHYKNEQEESVFFSRHLYFNNEIRDTIVHAMKTMCSRICPFFVLIAITMFDVS